MKKPLSKKHSEDEWSICLLKENVFIGLATRQVLEVLEEYGEIGAVARDIFYDSSFEFYVAAAKYAILI